MADRIGIIVDLVGAREAYNSIQQLTAAVQNLNNMSANINVNLNGRGGGGNNNSNARNIHQQFQTLQRDSIDLASTVRSLGDVFMGLGRASGAVASFATSIGNSFSKMNQVFKTDIGSTVLKTLTYNATNAVTGNLNKTISRYDILNTFTQYMQLAGVGRYAAGNALDRVNESILGLPIGLDEAAQRLRRYQMFMGDTNAATDLTIGVQNAVLAGGATSAAKTQAYNLIERLIATGGLTNIRQWQALLVGLGVSQRYIAEELGTDPKNLLQDLSSKAISTDQFLAALQRLGSGATDAAVKLNNALGIYKNTLEAWLSNIQFAFTRGNANIISALNESLLNGTGQGITGYMSDTRNAINEMYKGGVSFITNNPEQIADLVDDAKNLISVVMNFSGTQFARQAMENLGYLMQVIANALERIPAGKLEEFAAFATTLAGPLGKLFSAVSSGAPIMYGIFERFRDYDWDAQIDEIVEAGSSLAEVVHGILNLIDDPAMQKLIAYGLVWGKPVEGFFKAIGTGLRDIAGAMMFFKGAEVSLGVGAGTILTNLGIGALATPLALLTNRGMFASLYKDRGYFETMNEGVEGMLSLLTGGTAGTGQTGTRGKSMLDSIGTASGKLGEIGTKIKGIGDSILQAAGVTGYAEEEYMSLAAIVEESVDIQISAFEKLKTEAAKSFSELFGIWSGNTDINNRWSSALGTLMNYGLQNPESMAVIQELANQGPQAGLETAENWVNEINAGRGLDQTTQKFNEYAESANNAAAAQARLEAVFSQDAMFDFADALEIASAALGVDGLYITEQLRHFFGENDTITRDQLSEFIATLSEGLGEAKEAAKNGYNGVSNEITKGGRKAANEAQKANAAIARAMESLNVNPDQATAAIAEWGWAVQQGIISAKILAVAAANDAVSAINAALGNVRATPGSASVDRRTGRTSGFTQTPYANGGIIYAANGMLLDFGAIGTDTVPAMLTPGEFVVRRAAVNRVGIPFLQRLNSLDMAGAFDRAIKTGVFSGGGMVRNYYRDNHAQVTMNNYRASQDYSSRRMGRYVRSL